MKVFNYKTLVKLTFKHDYYSKGLSSDFSVIPSTDCKKLLAKNRLIFKDTGYGMVIMGDAVKDGSNYKLKYDIQSDIKLTFALKLKNRLFFNFTDIPIKLDPTKIFYFNNLTNHASAGQLFLINKNEIPKTSSNNALLTFSSGYYHYSYPYAGPDPVRVGTLSFMDDGFSVDQEAKKSDNTCNFYYDLKPYSPGRCRFTVDGVTENFYSLNELAKEQIFGIVEIFIKNSVPAAYRFLDSNFRISLKEYIIPFTNRSTVWRYFVYDKITNKLTTPKIDMAGRRIELMSTATSTNYPDEYTLFQFKSVNPADPAQNDTIPLQEEKVANIKLTGKTNGSTIDLVKNLPNPGVNLIKPDETDNSIIYSDIIIYV